MVVGLLEFIGWADDERGFMTMVEDLLELTDSGQVLQLSACTKAGGCILMTLVADAAAEPMLPCKLLCECRWPEVALRLSAGTKARGCILLELIAGTAAEPVFPCRLLCGFR